MNRRDLLYLVLKGFLAWLLLSALLGVCGEWLIRALFPFIKAVMISMMPELSPGLKLLKSPQSVFDFSIELSALVLRPIYLNAGQYIQPGANLKSTADMLHVLVPLVIEWSILLAWPVRNWMQRLWLLALGLPMAILVVLGTLPAQLLGNLEISFQDIALTGSNPRQAPWFVDWMIFCEMGGRWLLGIAAAWLCIQLRKAFIRDIKPVSVQFPL